MKNIKLFILILGLWAPLVHAAETKESAQEQAKNAATIDLANAIYRLDTSGVLNALDEGASLTTLVRTYKHMPEDHFITTDPRWGYPCMAILVDTAMVIDPNQLLNDGHSVKQTITNILAALVNHGLDINAPAEIQDGTYVQTNAPLLAIFNFKKFYYQGNQALKDPYFIQALLDNGANINQQAQIIKNEANGVIVYLGGQTALMLAVISKKTAIFKLLLEYGADTTIKDAQEHDVMYYINKSAQKDEFLKILNDYKKEVHDAARAGARTNPQAWAPASSVVADYLAGELEAKSKQEEHEEDEE